MKFPHSPLQAMSAVASRLANRGAGKGSFYMTKSSSMPTAAYSDGSAAHLCGGPAVARRRLAALRRAHAGGREGDRDALPGHVHLDAVPAEHVLAHARHAAGALKERQVLFCTARTAGNVCVTRRVLKLICGLV